MECRIRHPVSRGTRTSMCIDRSPRQAVLCGSRIVPIRSRGFSLLEIIVVVGLIALVMTFAAYTLNNQLPGQQLRSSAKELAAELRFTKSHAMATGQAQTFQINANTRQWNGAKNHSGELPKSLEIIATTAKREQPEDGVAAIKFFPDGAATGGRIVLQHDTAKWQVDVKWLTGEVTVTKPAATR